MLHVYAQVDGLNIFMCSVVHEVTPPFLFPYHPHIPPPLHFQTRIPATVKQKNIKKKAHKILKNTFVASRTCELGD